MHEDVIDYRCYSNRNAIPFGSRHPVYCNAARKSRDVSRARAPKVEIIRSGMPREMGTVYFATARLIAGHGTESVSSAGGKRRDSLRLTCI